MMAFAYYNEIDPYAAEWLENLISAKLVANGVVDRRSIVDVAPEDLKGFNQCHFFAGIGVWSHALMLAKVGDDEEVWTGSCPCQPFSSAGEGRGFEDERHLWPELFRLIRGRRPARVMGEQVASKDGLAWLDLVCDDVEGAGYTLRAADTCAAGFGAPHIRQRLYWDITRAADSDNVRLQRRERSGSSGAERTPGGHFTQHGSAGGLGNATGAARERVAGSLLGTEAQVDCEDRQVNGSCSVRPEHAGDSVCGLADTTSTRLEVRAGETRGSGGQEFGPERLLAASQLDNRERPRPTNGFWRAADWLFCRDGKWRPVRPCSFPLAHGAAGRMGRLRAYGNALNAQQAAAFIEAVW